MKQTFHAYCTKCGNQQKPFSAFSREKCKFCGNSKYIWKVETKEVTNDSTEV